MEHPRIKRFAELLGLAARAWWVLVIGFLFGVLEIIEIENRVQRHLYVLGAIAAFTLIAVLIWVGYKALVERDEARSEAQAARDDLNRHPQEEPKPIPPLQLAPGHHEITTEENRIFVRPVTDDDAKKMGGESVPEGE